jgi:hypothetical protein
MRKQIDESGQRFRVRMAGAGVAVVALGKGEWLVRYVGTGRFIVGTWRLRNDD